MTLEQADQGLDEMGDHGRPPGRSPRYRPKIMTEIIALAQNREALT
jgi:hypothetical protein